jgi:hypothetical protein
MRIGKLFDRHQDRQGAAAAELAVILPVLVTIVLGCVDFGRYAFNHIAVTNAARAGAAYGAMNNYTASTYNTWAAGITQAAQNEISQPVGSSNVGNLAVNITPQHGCQWPQARACHDQLSVHDDCQLAVGRSADLQQSDSLRAGRTAPDPLELAQRRTA